MENNNPHISDTSDNSVSNHIIEPERETIIDQILLNLKKNIIESVNLVLTGRYRIRVTNSGYEWVEDLKSFQLLQLWCKIEWELLYDQY